MERRQEPTKSDVDEKAERPFHHAFETPLPKLLLIRVTPSEFGSLVPRGQFDQSRGLFPERDVDVLDSGKRVILPKLSFLGAAVDVVVDVDIDDCAQEERRKGRGVR